MPHLDDEIARVTIDGISLTTTPDHPFYTLEQGWVQAGLLWPGARVKTTSGVGVVGAVETAPYSGLLWDLTVDGAYSFFVGSGPWLVHNCPADDLIEGGLPPIPGNPFSGADAVHDAFDHLKKFHGLEPEVASANLHALKNLYGLPPDAKVIFGKTGDIYDEISHEYLGNLITGH